ncbi:hypothetical protein [Sorangium sp. So ce362]|uniref:hypothetical protein n=1 Tax=Sorangium sp. So ce362 TaxID=3133303 RepID=UPI003F5E673E
MGTKLVTVKSNASRLLLSLYREYESTAETEISARRFYELAEELGIPEDEAQDAREYLAKQHDIDDIAESTLELSPLGIAKAESALEQQSPRPFAPILAELRAAASSLPAGPREEVLKHADVIELTAAAARLPT